VNDRRRGVREVIGLTIDSGIGLNWYEFLVVCNDGLLKGLDAVGAKTPMFHQDCFWCVFGW
jgi:hypothetical protein